MIQVNEYFNGNVKSLSLQTSEGNSTVGVIETGEYEFKTTQKEIMVIVEGELAAWLPAGEQWQIFTRGQSFEVPANASFKVKATHPMAYLCYYR